MQFISANRARCESAERMQINASKAKQELMLSFISTWIDIARRSLSSECTVIDAMNRVECALIRPKYRLSETKSNGKTRMSWAKKTSTLV
jgi:hypothetical protein